MAKDKKIPDEIMELARKRQQEYYNEYGERYSIRHNLGDINILQDGKSETIDRMFAWGESPEGYEFWRAVNSGAYEEFYKKYPDKKAKPTYEIY